MRIKNCITLLLTCMVGAMGYASEPLSTEQLPIQTDFGAVMINPDGTDFTVYPAIMTLGDLGGSDEGSQWCDVAIWLSPFSIAEYPGFRVRLQRGYSERGVVQLFARNHYSASNYAGPYIPFDANSIELSGEFTDYDTNGYFDDDPVCIWFAIQYTQKGKERLAVQEVALIDEDGEEVISRNIRNDSWRPSPDWVDPEPVYDTKIRFDGKGTIGYYKSEVLRRQGHTFTFQFAEPLPKGFKFKVMHTIDYDFDTYTYEVPAGTLEWTSPIITEDYRAAFLEYKGSYPQTVHVKSAERKIYDTTGLSPIISDCSVIARQYYSIDGSLKSELTPGINIVREIMSDGTSRIRKVAKN